MFYFVKTHIWPGYSHVAISYSRSGPFCTIQKEFPSICWKTSVVRDLRQHPLSPTKANKRLSEFPHTCDTGRQAGIGVFVYECMCTSIFDMYMPCACGKYSAVYTQGCITVLQLHVCCGAVSCMRARVCVYDHTTCVWMCMCT